MELLRIQKFMPAYFIQADFCHRIINGKKDENFFGYCIWSVCNNFTPPLPRSKNLMKSRHMKIKIRLQKTIGLVVRKYHIVLKNVSIFQEKPNNKKVTNKKDKLVIYRSLIKLCSHLTANIFESGPMPTPWN